MINENTTTHDMNDPVRSITSDEVQARLDRDIEKHIATYTGRSTEDITDRINELDREWDIERVLELNASSLAFIGTFLGATTNKKWLLLPVAVLPFLFQHAIQGWCPPITIFRRMGIRTRKEIDLEKYALKFIRGDFGLPTKKTDATEAIQAATR